MRVCLVTPPSNFLLDERVFVSLGILKIGAVLKQAGIEVDHLDLTGVSNYEQAAMDYQGASVFAVTATTPQIPAAVRIRNVLQGKVILGGPHVTLVNAAAKRNAGRSQQALDTLQSLFHCVVAGDGEEAIFRAIATEDRLVDADDPASAMWQTSEKFTQAPWPDRSLVDLQSYHYSVEGERALSMVTQLGCPFESITADSFLFTSRGFETVAEFRYRVKGSVKCVNSGDLVAYGISEPVATRDGRRAASYFVEESIRDVYEVRHQFGIPLKGTAEHGVMAVNGDSLDWKNISDLRKGDWIACRFPDPVTDSLQPVKVKAELRTVPPGGFKSKPIRTPSVMSEELAWLTGFMLGDGCLPMDGRPSVHVCVTDKVRERLARSFRNLFDVDLRIYATDTTNNMQHGWVHSRAVYEFFVQSLGISPANKLNVPEIIRTSPRSVIASFLEGLWDADGYTDAQSNYLTTANKEFARQIAMLLLMVKKVPLLRDVTGKHGECWRVGIVKAEHLPTQKSLYKSTKSGKWHWRAKKSLDRTGIRRRTMREAGLSHPLDIDNVFYSRVQDVIPAGRERVFDLTVPDGENFIASGVIVHNCGFCGGRSSPMLRRIRTRPADNVIRELMHLHETYGVKGMMFLDDELNVNKSVVSLMKNIAALGIDWRFRGFVKAELFTEEQAEAMYGAGFRWLLCGFESGHPRILKNINKKATREQNTRMLRTAHKAGLKVKALMSFGHPGESEETILATRDWLLEEKPDDFDCTVITVYPGTPYYDRATHLDGNVYKYEFNGDVLYSYNLDFTKEVAYYKGVPGEYKAFVWTDFISRERLAQMRDEVEDEVRTKLGIAYPVAAAAVNFEHSVGMKLPEYVLRNHRDPERTILRKGAAY